MFIIMIITTTLHDLAQRGGHAPSQGNAGQSEVIVLETEVHYYNIIGRTHIWGIQQ